MPAPISAILTLGSASVSLFGAYFSWLALFVRISPFQRLDNGAAASLSPNGTTSGLS
jgi:hypothetical protein